MNLFRHIAIGASLLMSSYIAYAADITPEGLTRSSSQEVMTILRQDPNMTAEKAITLVETKVLPHFDFERMTQLAVGKYWAKTTPEQKTKLTTEFRTMLLRTYINQLLNYKNAKVEVKPSMLKAGQTTTLVKMQVSGEGLKTLNFDYNFSNTPKGWKVYNISVEGVSLLVNYRNSFGAKIKQSGIEGLISAIEAKNAKAKAGK